GQAKHERAWVVTPYNSSRLPELDPKRGLERMLTSQSVVHLTAASAARETQGAVPPPGDVRLDQLRQRAELDAEEPFFDEGLDIKPSTARMPLDAVWCVAFGDDGLVRATWRGKAAMRILPAK